MHKIYFTTMAAAMISAVPLLTCAESLRCGGDIISPGDTQQQLLDACGNPTSREGADWLYATDGSLPMVVTIGNGVVMFIRNQDESDAFTTHPLGDRP